MFNHKHQAEWTNWKWYKIVEHSQPASRKAAPPQRFYNLPKQSHWLKSRCLNPGAVGDIPIQTTTRAQLSKRRTRLHPSLMEPSFPWLCALLTTVLQLTLHWDQQCSNGLYTIYTSCEEGSHSRLLTPRSLAQSWRMLGVLCCVLNSDFYLASSHARSFLLPLSGTTAGAKSRGILTAPSPSYFLYPAPYILLSQWIPNRPAPFHPGPNYSSCSLPSERQQLPTEARTLSVPCQQPSNIYTKTRNQFQFLSQAT